MEAGRLGVLRSRPSAALWGVLRPAGITRFTVYVLGETTNSKPKGLGDGLGKHLLRELMA